MSDPETTLTDGLIDKPKRVREGEELDVDALDAWLRANTALLGERDTLAVKQFPAGYSNLTYLIRAGATELVLRRPPFGNTIKTGHDMSREHTVLS